MHLKRILVGTDFSEHSHEAMRHALSIARTTGAEIRLVHADSAFPPWGTEPVFELAAQARKRLDSEMALWTDQSVNISQRFVTALPSVGVLSAARKFQANLIVVGSRGRTGISRFLMGSVAEQVARRAECDVLVARGTAPEAGYRQLLVPTDFSERSKLALARAHELIQDEGSIHLLHCWELPDGKVEYWAANATSLRESMQKSAEELGAAMTAPNPNALASVALLQRESSARHGIQEALAEQSYDLVVMGSHGRAWPSRWLMGSVAEATMRHSPIPVYVVRQQEVLPTELDGAIR